MNNTNTKELRKILGPRKDNEDNHNEVKKKDIGGTVERQDSKKFWVSHIRQGSNSLRSLHGEDSKLKGNREIINSDQESVEITKDSRKLNLSNNSSESVLEAVNNGINRPRDSEPNFLEANSDVTNIHERSDCVTTPSLGLEIISIYELYNYLNDGSINPCMCDPSYLLLFDTRDKLSFEKLHIVSAKQSSALHSEILATNLNSFVSSGNQVALDEYTFVIVYGNAMLDSKASNAEKKFLQELETYDVKPLFLGSGFESFREAFPFLCTQKVMQKQDLKDYRTYPSIVLTDQLYQGRGDQATNLKIIEDLNITHIVNISCEHASAFPDRVEYLTIKLEDVSQTNLKPYFPKAFSFIENCFKLGGRVLVHCNLGVSRSSTITIAYLMKSRNWNLKTAHDFLKDRRSCVRPNRGFLQQLSLWEVEILGEKDTDIDEIWF